MKKLLDLFYGAVETLCKLMMIAQIICVTVVVIGRYVFNSTPAWGEEATLLCLVWIALLSAAISVREERHMKVTVIEYLVPKKLIPWMDTLALFGLLAFAVLMIIHGAKLTQLTGMSILPGLRIKSSWLYGSVPASSMVLLVAVLERLAARLTGKEI